MWPNNSLEYGVYLLLCERIVLKCVEKLKQKMENSINSNKKVLHLQVSMIEKKLLTETIKWLLVKKIKKCCNFIVFRILKTLIVNEICTD